MSRNQHHQSVAPAAKRHQRMDIFMAGAAHVEMAYSVAWLKSSVAYRGGSRKHQRRQRMAAWRGLKHLWLKTAVALGAAGIAGENA